VIDVHTHCLLPEHWGSEWSQHWQPVTGRPYPRTSPAEFDQAMTAGGVSTAIVFGIRAAAVGVDTPPEFVAEFCRDAKTPTVGFTALDLSDDDLLRQVDRAVDCGLRGATLYPAMAGFDPSDSVFDPFYARAAKEGWVLLWHMGGTVTPVGRLSVSHPLLLDEVARRHPELVQIIAHAGSPWHRDAIAVMRKNPRVFADVSGIWQRPAEGRSILVAAHEFGVADRLLFGSDFPLYSPAEVSAGVSRLCGPELAGLGQVPPDLAELILADDKLAKLGLSAQ
jgi:predicted TIM-barrel fold metal-dependent hydrolase